MTDEGRHRTPARSKRGRSTTDRVVSSSLAVAACAGMVGLLGLRSAQDAQSAQAAPAQGSPSTAVPVSSAGLSQQQLDAYAAALETERLQLVAYRDQLQQVALQLQGVRAPGGDAVAGATTPAAASQPRVRATQHGSARPRVARQQPSGQQPSGQQPSGQPISEQPNNEQRVVQPTSAPPQTTQQASEPPPPAAKPAPQVQAPVVQAPPPSSSTSSGSPASAPQSTTRGSKA